MNWRKNMVAKRHSWLNMIVAGALIGAFIGSGGVLAQPVTGTNSGLSPIFGSTGTFSGAVTAPTFTATSLFNATGGAALRLQGGGTSTQIFGCGYSTGDQCQIANAIGASAATGAIPAFSLYHTNGALGANDLLIDVGDNSVSKFKVDAEGDATLAGEVTATVVSTTVGNFTSAQSFLVPSGQGFLHSGATTGMALPGTAQVDLYVGGTIKASLTATGASQQMGTGTGYAFLVGSASVISTAVGNVGNCGSPDDLVSYPLPASSLITTNRAVRIHAWGTCANDADAKTFTLNFGSQVILTHACTVSVANERWEIDSTVIRTGSSTQDWWSTYKGSTGAAGAFEFDPEIGTATQTESGTIVIKMQATACTNTNNIVQEGMTVEVL